MDFLILAVGVVLALAGGELFVRGAVGIADHLRVPPGVIGATVAAFATSSPELAVAISSARDDRSAVAVGDALGSNVVNLALVLGIATLVAPLALDRSDLRRNLPFALVAPLLTGVLAWDGELSRVDGTVLLLVFAGWLIRTAFHARRTRAAVEVLEEARPARALGATAIGLLLLVGAGQSIVWAAKGIGETLGLDEFVVGATLVAIGTSTPELATTVISRVRGHDEIGVGTVLGSNIFDNLWIVGVATVISPAAISLGEISVADHRRGGRHAARRRCTNRTHPALRHRPRGVLRQLPGGAPRYVALTAPRRVPVEGGGRPWTTSPPGASG